jgi:TIR domain/Tetratricopeptide repeat
MASGRVPNASEVLDLLDRLQRSDSQRGRLYAGWDIYGCAVEDGVIGQDGIDWLAERMQELNDEGLIGFRAKSGGSSPLPRVWSGATIQELHDWRVTAAGRRDALVYRQVLAASTSEPSHEANPPPPAAAPMPEGHDIFVSHASEDKDSIARPLATRLRALGYRVWFDESELRVGMSLRRSIDKGLAGSDRGIVILSPSFLGKEWPQRELDGLAARETADGEHLILPVWHGVDRQSVTAYSPTLADRVATNTRDGLDQVVTQLVSALGPPNGRRPTAGEGFRLPDVRLSPMPTNVPLSPVLLGSQLLRLVDDAFEMVFDVDHLPAGSDRRETAELFDDLRDWSDMLGEIGLAQRDELEEDLSQRIQALVDAGVAIVAGPYARSLRSESRVERWPGLILRAIPLDEPRSQPTASGGTMSSQDATTLALAQVLVDKGDLPAAEAQLRPIADRGNTHAMLLLGLVLRDRRNLAEAADVLREAADAGRVDGLATLGMVLRDLGKLDEAEAVLRRATSL